MLGADILRALPRRIVPALAIPRADTVALLLPCALGTVLRALHLGAPESPYYAAAVVSMLQNAHNFLFGSFDAGGYVMVDKPPVALWLQALPVALLGPTDFAVALPQVLAGVAAIPILFALVRPTFGPLAASVAALTLAVLPVNVAVDARNEPDGLLAFALLLAALCVLQAARKRSLRWTAAAAVLVGTAFNIKMLAGFVPLPAFVLYTLVASWQPWRRLAARVALGAVVLPVAAFWWAGLYTLTPPDQRPFVGSTTDNSIWSLIFDHNGFDRFTSPIGGGLRPGGAAGPGQGRPPGNVATAGQATLGDTTGDTTADAQEPSAQPPTTPDSRQRARQQDPNAAGGQPNGRQRNPNAGAGPGAPGAQGGDLPGGFLAGGAGGAGGAPQPAAMLTGELGGELGFLLAPVLSGTVLFTGLWLWRMRRPGRVLAALSQPAVNESVLWGSWLLTEVAVFGMARATGTHPYYLSALGVPLAAVLGISAAQTWRLASGDHRSGLLLLALPFGAVAFATVAATAVQMLVRDLALVTTVGGILVLGVAVLRRAPRTVLRIGGVACLAGVLLVPAAQAIEGRTRFPGQFLGRGRAVLQAEEPASVKVADYIRAQGDAGSVFALATVRSMDAAPFILDSLPALAVGGFSGTDPVFTAESFASLAEQGKVRYFLLTGPFGGAPNPTNARANPNLRPQAPNGALATGGFPPGFARGAGSPIVQAVRSSWTEVSAAAGLPAGMLYHYVGSAG